MMNINNSIIIFSISIIILIIVIYYKYYKNDGFIPENQKNIMAKEIIDNKELFSESREYKDARAKIAWLDPVTYHDARDLYINNSLSLRNMMNKLN